MRVIQVKHVLFAVEGKRFLLEITNAAAVTKLIEIFMELEIYYLNICIKISNTSEISKKQSIYG